MVSINSNAAATSALQSLRNIDTAVGKVQSRISTGLRIVEARDNAAFWSIAATLRSDRITATSVMDGLSVGAVSVDTAYNGHQMATELLVTYRSKIIDALKGAVSRDFAQKEIDSIKGQLVSVATSSEVFGQNWIDIDSSAASFHATKTIISSVDQLLQNASHVRTIDIDTKALVLLDQNPSGGGILDTPKRPLPEIVTDRLILGTAEVQAKTATVRYDFNLSALQPDRKIYFQMEYNGSVTPGGSWPGVLVPLGGYGSVLDFATALGAEMTGFADVAVVPGESAVTISTKTAGQGASISIRQIVVYKNGGYVRDASDPLERYVPIEGMDGKDAVPFVAASTSVPFAQPFSLIDDQSIAFNLSFDSLPARRIVVDKFLIDKATGRNDGRVATVLEFHRVLQSAIDPAGDAGLTIDVQSDEIRIRSSASSGPTKISISDVSLESGSSVMAIQLASKSDDELRSYVSVLDRAIDATIAASAYLGAISARISIQSSFQSKRADTIQKGTSSIVDADMEAESMKVQALQVKRELSLQSLSIANFSLKNLLVLFQRS
jgi:flagellin